MKKIRINELARELEVKPGVILDLLPEFGVSEKKTHSSSIDEDVAISVKDRLFGENGENRSHARHLEAYADGRGEHDGHDSSAHDRNIGSGGRTAGRVGTPTGTPGDDESGSGPPGRPRAPAPSMQPPLRATREPVRAPDKTSASAAAASPAPGAPATPAAPPGNGEAEAVPSAAPPYARRRSFASATSASFAAARARRGQSERVDSGAAYRSARWRKPHAVGSAPAFAARACSQRAGIAATPRRACHADKARPPDFDHKSGQPCSRSAASAAAAVSGGRRTSDARNAAGAGALGVRQLCRVRPCRVRLRRAAANLTPGAPIAPRPQGTRLVGQPAARPIVPPRPDRTRSPATAADQAARPWSAASQCATSRQSHSRSTDFPWTYSPRPAAADARRPRHAFYRPVESPAGPAPDASHGAFAPGIGYSGSYRAAPPSG